MQPGPKTLGKTMPKGPRCTVSAKCSEPPLVTHIDLPCKLHMHAATTAMEVVMNVDSEPVKLHYEVASGADIFRPQGGGYSS